MKSHYNEVEKVSVSILGDRRTLKLCTFKLGYIVRDKESAQRIFDRVLNGIEKNIGKAITQSEYTEFVNNGKVLSFWSQGVAYQIKNGTIEEFDGSGY